MRGQLSMFKSSLSVAIFVSAAILLSVKTHQVESLCSSNSQCRVGTYCCKGNFVLSDRCQSSCVGRTCSKDSDCCAPRECCQNRVCTRTCLVDSALATWIIVVIVIGVLLGVILPIGIVICCCCCAATAVSVSRTPVQQGVVFTQPGLTVMATQSSVLPSGSSSIQSPYINQVGDLPPQELQDSSTFKNDQYYG